MIDANGVTFVRDEARMHAVIGEKMAGEVLTIVAPIPPAWDPINIPAHARISLDLALGQRIADLRSVERDLEAAVAQTMGEPMSTALTKVLVVGTVEMFAIARLFSHLGNAPGESVLYAIGVVVCFFGLLAASRSAKTARASRLTMAAFIAGAGAIAVLRAQQAGALATAIEAAAVGALAVLIAIGPAVFVEPLLHKLRVTYPNLLRLRSRRRERETTERRLQHAQMQYERVHDDRVTALARRAQTIAIYDLEYARARAEIERNDPNRTA